MTEVKTIGDYINALPDEIREEVRRLNTPENGGTDEAENFSEYYPCSFLTSSPLNWMFLWKMCDVDKLKEWSKKYTLTEKEGKYYTNW